MPRTTDDHIGARISAARKMRQLTQRELVDLAGCVSYSMLTKVEQGREQPSPALIGALARALGVSVSDLLGQPYLEELRADHLDRLMQPVREALDVYDLGVDPDVTPRGPDELHTEAEELCLLVRATDLKQVAARLPGLIHEATTAVHAAPSTRAWQTLASGYRTAYDVATKLGYVDLGAIALDRLDWAAERASDPVLSGMRQYMRALAHLRAGAYRHGDRLVAVAGDRLDQAEESRERDTVRGQLHLGAAVLAARQRDADTAEAHLNEAERLARITGPAERVHWLSFGRTNVAVHRVSVLGELDRHAEAVEAARQITIPESWPASRAAHHYAELARSQVWTGRVDDGFATLKKARAAAPQQTRYHPLVRQTVGVIAHARRTTPGTLSNYAHWLGM